MQVLEYYFVLCVFHQLLTYVFQILLEYQIV